MPLKSRFAICKSKSADLQSAFCNFTIRRVVPADDVWNGVGPASRRKEGPIVYGHHHLNASNVDAQKKFFVETLGGKAIKIGTNNTEVVEFPNVLIFFRQQAPTAGTRGTTVNHIGFSVPNLRKTVDKVKADGYRMVTREEAWGAR